MQELLDQIMYFARGAWRYRWWAMAAGWVVCLIGWVVLAAMPDVYEARARVYVDTSSEISRLLDDQILAPNIYEELAYVQQSMLGRLQLEKVARKAGLLLSASNDDERDAIIDRLSGDVQIVGSGGWRGTPDNTYTISYRHENPAKAAEVVKTILDIFIEDTLGGQQSSSDVSRKFLLEQIAEYEARLQTAELRLATFNRENYDRLPGQQGGYFERLQAETDMLEATERSITQARSRLHQQEQQLRGEAPRVAGNGEIDPNSLNARIQQHRARLDELRLRYTDSYPDVVAMRETIGRLEAQREAELLDPGAVGASGVASNNPVYQALQIAINETRAEIATLQADKQLTQKKIDNLRTLIDEIADVEAQSARLNRDYKVLQTQYQALVDSLERERLTREAQISEKVEFRIIDPPKADPDPVAPLRLAIVPGILLAGIGAGIAFALLISQLKPVVESPRWLELRFGVPVLGTVQSIESSESAGILKGQLFYIGVGMLLVIAFGLVFSIEALGDGFRTLILP
ncbi:MAG: XrtA system polysaccharide chain length determinant [Pseudomonadales bacterium]